MSAQRSVLLNHQLPAALLSGLVREGIDPSAFWLCAETDLNLSGSYEPVYLVADEAHIHTVALPTSANARHVRHSSKTR